MVTDVYTKGVLTIIAGALLYLCSPGTADRTTLQAQANDTADVQLFRIVGWQGEDGKDYPVSDEAGLPVSEVRRPRVSRGALSAGR